MTRAEIKAKEEARLEAERRNEEARLEAERRAEAAKLEAEKRRVEEAERRKRAEEEAARLEAERIEKATRIETERRRAEEAQVKELERWIAFGPPLKNPIGMEFVLVKPGRVTIGLDYFPLPGSIDSFRSREVYMPYAYYIGKYEVTQAQWKVVMGNNPSWFKGDDLPVEYVTKKEALEYCKKLSEKTGVEHRLPTEVEWEYACRAGTNSLYSFGDSHSMLEEYAWTTENSENKTHRVGQKKPNSWGIYDMHGNVWEWCGDSNAQRGGSWHFLLNRYVSAVRNSVDPNSRTNYAGFRVVVSITKQ